MKRNLCALLLIAVAVSPAWAEKKITVAQLGELLATLHQQNKSDTEVAFELKQVELTELLDRATMNSFVGSVPGLRSTEQIYILEAQSATLPPPDASVPQTPPPDAAAQSAMLDRAFAYAAKTYAALPRMTAIKTTLRFQDNMQAVAASSGVTGGAKDASVGSGGPSAADQYVRYIQSSITPMALQSGAEKLKATEDKAQYGQNGLIRIDQPSPALSAVLSEARASGPLTFVRWERVNGKPSAVFAFNVERKQSRYNVDICCFPRVMQAGTARFYTSTLSSVSGLNGGGVKGDYHTSTDWEKFHSIEPYHGQVFIDPETGIVVRLITMVDFKSGESVRRQDERIDYAPVQVGGRTLILPVKSIVQSEVVPEGDSGVAAQTTRHTYFTSEYKNYALD